MQWYFWKYVFCYIILCFCRRHFNECNINVFARNAWLWTFNECNINVFARNAWLRFWIFGLGLRSRFGKCRCGSRQILGPSLSDSSSSVAANLQKNPPIYHLWGSETDWERKLINSMKSIIWYRYFKFKFDINLGILSYRKLDIEPIYPQTDKTFRNVTINTIMIVVGTCVYQGVRNVRFSENLACFVFLKHPFWNSLFCLITDVV